MTHVPQVRPEHGHTGKRILARMADSHGTCRGIDAWLRAAWDRVAPGQPIAPMAHYFQSLTAGLTETDPDLARCYCATLFDHGIETGVPRLIAKGFALAKPPAFDGGIRDFKNLDMLLRYLAILDRLSGPRLPSAHEWLHLSGRGAIDAPPAIVPEPLSWENSFLAALRRQD